MERHLCCQLMAVFVVQIGMFHRALHILTNIKCGTRQVLVPPMDEFVVVGGTVANLPVNLRYAIVHPAVGIPQQYVGIQVIVVLETVGTTAIGIVFLVAVDAERRHTDLHPRLGLVDSLVKLFDEEVDIETSPVTTIADAVGVGTILGVVGNLHASHGIRIEIVVDMEAIDIVARHDIANYRADIVAALLQGRIEQRQTIVLEGPFRMLHDHVVTGITVSHLRLGTIGIDPRMKLHTTLVALSNHPLQGVPIRIRLSALFACQIVAPRFELTLI